ncbi:MAG: phage holin family protein [Propionibacteriaceae bacterium]|jgi:hypothetical protein|nr:phage holin family protein [Propionibacteriaceae bacterium]
MANEVPSVSEILKNVQADVTTIVRGEIELVKAELIPQAKSAGVGAGLFGAAGYFALTASILLFIGASIGVGDLLYHQLFGVGEFAAAALGFVTVAVALLVLAGILALIGKGRLNITGPEQTIGSVEQSVGAVRNAVTTSTSAIADTSWLPKKGLSE